MTSQKSSTDARKARPFRYTLLSGLKGSALAPAAVNCAVFIVVTVVLSAFKLIGTHTTQDEAGNIIIKSAAEGYRYQLITESGFATIFLLVAVIAAALVAAMFSFRFITNKKTVNVYYSLGISRDKLYLAKYIAGIVPLIISIAIPFFISFFINMAVIGYSSSLMWATLYYIFSFSVSAIVVYSVAAAVFSAVGTFFEAGIFSVIILAFPTLLFSCLEVLMKKFLLGSPYGYSFPFANSAAWAYSDTAQKLYSRFEYLNPIMLDRSELAKWGAMSTDGLKNPSSELSSLLGAQESLNWIPSFLIPL